MKRVLLLGVFSLVFASCTTETLNEEIQDLNLVTDTSATQSTNSGCDAAEPVVKITNNSLSAIDVEIYDKTGAIVSAQFDIAIGASSDWLLFSPGSVRVFITIGTTSRVVPLNMDTCMQYHGTLDAQNKLDTEEPTVVE